MPGVSFPVDDPEDIKALSEALGTMVPLGMRVAMADVNKRMGFRLPDADEAVLEFPANVVPGPGAERAHRLRATCPSCGEIHRASAEPGDDDPLVSEALEHWEADMGPTVTAILAAAKSADGYEAFLASLDKMTPDVSDMTDRLAIQLMKARGDGDIDA